MVVPKWYWDSACAFHCLSQCPTPMTSTLWVSREGSSSDIWRLARPRSAHSTSGHALSHLALALGVGFRPGTFPTHEGHVGTEWCLQQPGPFL